MRHGQFEHGAQAGDGQTDQTDDDKDEELAGNGNHRSGCDEYNKAKKFKRSEVNSKGREWIWGEEVQRRPAGGGSLGGLISISIAMAILMGSNG